MTAGWRDRPLADLLADHGLDGRVEAPFPNDGWSGASFTSLRDEAGRRFVLKRTSLARDWIARWTRDGNLREGWLATVAADGGPLAGRAPYLGAAADPTGDGVAILMPDLSDELIAWDRPGVDPVIDRATLGRVVRAVADLHRSSWVDDLGPARPWCPLAERLTLLGPRAAASYAAEGNPVGERFIAGWSAFGHVAPRAASDLVERLDADVAPLVAALGRLPAVGLHGDLKLANVALLTGDAVAFIDWQMTLVAPIAVELGWLLVSNSHSLPAKPDEVLDAYVHAAGDASLGDADAQRDLAWIVGLVMRGWRKGLDAEAGLTIASGVAAGDDLAWWCERALRAADRRL